MSTNDQPQPMSAPHPAFEFLRSRRVDSMNITVEEYRHRKTGAAHYHIHADDDQNTFLVAFRTVPQDSTGVAHILEHTSLCGSRNYPVRDPFFMMTRRSLNTFMNAFTSSDWTAYPFASRNRKDFDNLLAVYIDAVFYPSLDELDFAQEGHRVEFAETDNPDSDLVFKGVVFNEMKGAMSSPISALWQKLTEELFPTVTYHHNSGGDPAHIPDLTYEQLKAFHQRHYHPSNAIFMTYGDISAAEHQARFEELALKEFEHLPLDIAVPDEQRFGEPRQVTATYAMDSDEPTEDRTHIVLGWLLGQNTDPEEVLITHLLSGVLLDNSASPLRRVLETSELGSAPSPLCGLQDSTREMVFACGLEGSNPEQADAVEALILDTLKQIADQGVEQEMVEAILHQLELSQREVSGDGFPYGLQLIVHALSPTIHGGDPVEALDIDDALVSLRESIQDPEFIPSLVRKHLLENNHRVRLVMTPDKSLSGERAETEAKRLAELKSSLTDADKQAIVARAHALEARQNQQDDADQLPKVGLEDIQKDLQIPEGERFEKNRSQVNWYSRGTNGLIYEDIILELPQLDEEMVDLLPILCDSMTEVGSGGRDYLQTQSLHAAYTGGIGARVSVRGGVDNVFNSRGMFVISGKALGRNFNQLTDLLFETWESARFDELPRLRELVAQERMHREQSVTGSGHGLAMTAAAAPLAPSASLAHRWSGLRGIKTLKALDNSLKQEMAVAELGEKLTRLRDLMVSAPRQFLLVGEEESRDSYAEQLSQRWADTADGRAIRPFEPTLLDEPRNVAWTTSTQVNFCAKAFPCVATDHPDAPALMVLASFLRNNYLHRAIREQGGAYGGGASFDSDAGAFRFFSYRDPRLAETLTDFDRSISWLLETDHPWRLLEESILGIISSIDKPGSPAGEAKKAFYAALHGRTPEQRRAYRARILEVRQEDLKRVAEAYLKPELAHTAVITSSATLAKQPELDLETINL